VEEGEVVHTSPSGKKVGQLLFGSQPA